MEISSGTALKHRSFNETIIVRFDETEEREWWFSTLGERSYLVAYRCDGDGRGVVYTSEDDALDAFYESLKQRCGDGAHESARVVDYGGFSAIASVAEEVIAGDDGVELLERQS